MEYPPVKPHQIALHELRKNVRYDDYKKSFQHILDLAGSDVAAQLEVYQHYCGGYIISGKLEDANEMVQRAREVKAADATFYKANILLIEALYNCTQRATALSESQVTQALSLLEDHSSEPYFTALTIKVNNCLDSNNFEEGIRLCREIIEHAKANLLVSHRNAYNNLGMIYEVLGKYSESEANFIEALKLSEQLEYKQYIASTYGNLAGLALHQITETNQQQEHIADSIKYGLLALEIANQTSDTYFKAITLGNLGLSYSYTDLPEAIRYGQEALSLARSINVNYLIGSTMLWLAEIFERGGR